VIRWHIVVSTGQRRARIYYAGRLVRTFVVIVGAPATPTPQGEFFVEENIAEPPSFPGAPYALATSARSTVFTEFDGGPGQVALHGVGGGLGGTPGTGRYHLAGSAHLPRHAGDDHRLIRSAAECSCATSPTRRGSSRAP
jgi:hypothetical protein